MRLLALSVSYLLKREKKVRAQMNTVVGPVNLQPYYLRASIMLHNSSLKFAPFGRWDGAKARRPLPYSLGGYGRIG